MFALPYTFGIISRLRNRSLDSSKAQFTAQRKASRPPNILIYTGENDQNSERFEKTKELLKKCLHQDKYVIYQLRHDSVSQGPWEENTELLILTSDHILDKSCTNSFETYVQNGGKLLGFSKFFTLNDTVRLCGVGSGPKEVDLSEKLKYGQCLCVSGVDTIYEIKQGENVEVLAVSSLTSQAVAVGMLHRDGLAVFTTMQISIDALDEGSNNEIEDLLKKFLNFLGVKCGNAVSSVLTNAYLLGDDKDKDMFLRSIEELLIDSCFKGNDINIFFTENEDLSASDYDFPVVINGMPEHVSFSLLLYKDYLKTKHLGKLVIYTEVITSTQTILNGSLKLMKKIPKGCGLVLVGRQQTVGKGRGGNAWLSPDGCLSFSFPLCFELDSNLGRRLPFVQHIAALAVVEAVRGMKDYEDINMQIKWPNDIYCGRETKIGGILVNSAIQGRNICAVIGIGVNLENSEPTTCINEMIEQTNITSNLVLRRLNKEHLLARILNEMEDLVNNFQQFGPKSFLEKYYLRWLHSETQVKLGDENGETVTIRGLDDMGFLSVTNSVDEIQSLQPDGNSFDMMRNLITIKKR